jgi:hypothetical protein
LTKCSQKSKNKKQNKNCDLTKFGPLKTVLIFWEHFVTKANGNFEISMKFSIFHTQYDLFQKNFSPLTEAIFQFFGHKSSIKEETAKNIEKCLFQI